MFLITLLLLEAVEVDHQVAAVVLVAIVIRGTLKQVAVELQVKQALQQQFKITQLQLVLVEL
jgi:hypothetical protein